MRAPPQWPACAYLSPFTCVLKFESPEHIMRALVAAQGRDSREAVAEKPHPILRPFRKCLLWLIFYVPMRPCCRIAVKIWSMTNRAWPSTVVPPEVEAIAAARAPTTCSPPTIRLVPLKTPISHVPALYAAHVSVDRTYAMTPSNGGMNRHPP